MTYKEYKQQIASIAGISMYRLDKELRLRRFSLRLSAERLRGLVSLKDENINRNIQCDIDYDGESLREHLDNISKGFYYRPCNVMKVTPGGKVVWRSKLVKFNICAKGVA